jgi:hypothetical protein
MLNGSLEAHQLANNGNANQFTPCWQAKSTSGLSNPYYCSNLMEHMPCNYPIYIYTGYLVGGAITILKNDGVRQWEGLLRYNKGQ